MEHEILEDVEDKEEARLRERYYILKYRSNEPEFGYNKHTNLYTTYDEDDTAAYAREQYARRKIDNDKPLRTLIPVRCVETGEVYESIAKAAEAMNRSYSSLHKSLTRGNRCGGYHWERVETGTDAASA